MITITDYTVKSYVVTINGWYPQIGHVANICGMNFIIIPQRNQDGRIFLNFTDIHSGNSLKNIFISIIDFLEAETKEQAIVMFKEKSFIIEKYIKEIGSSNVYKATVNNLEKNEQRFGNKPKTKIYQNV